jgi:hypothetical protein
MKRVTSKIYRSDGRHYLYIPSGLLKDSAWPLPTEGAVSLEICGEKLVVERVVVERVKKVKA